MIRTCLKTGVPFLIGALAAVEMSDPYSQVVAVAAGILGSAAFAVAEKASAKVRKLIYGGVLIGAGAVAAHLIPRLGQVQVNKEPDFQPFNPQCPASEASKYDYSHFRYQNPESAAKIPETGPGCAERVAQAKEVLKCYFARELWTETQEETPFEVTCGPHTMVKSIEGTQTIVLGDESESLQYKLLFEMENIRFKPRLDQIDSNPCSRGPDAFAQEVEEAEYDTVLNAVNIAHGCKELNAWKEPLPPYPQNQQLALISQRKIGHTAYYVQQWFQRCNPLRLFCTRVYDAPIED